MTDAIFTWMNGEETRHGHPWMTDGKVGRSKEEAFSWASESSRLLALVQIAETGFVSEDLEEDTPRLAVTPERVPHNSVSSGEPQLVYHPREL